MSQNKKLTLYIFKVEMLLVFNCANNVSTLLPHRNQINLLPYWRSLFFFFFFFLLLYTFLLRDIFYRSLHKTLNKFFNRYLLYLNINFYILIINEKVLVLCEKLLLKFSSNHYVLRPPESEKTFFLCF